MLEVLAKRAPTVAHRKGKRELRISQSKNIAIGDANRDISS